MLDVLVVAPHPDDAELGLGGGIARMIKDGLRVGILDLTDGEPTPHGSREIRARETEAASKTLGISWRENLGLTNRSLQPTLEARQQLAEVFRRTRPNWLFAPYWEDAHPDHGAATQLIEEARFWSTLTKTDMAGAPHHPQRIFDYFCVHLRLAVQPAFVLDITEHWPAKKASLLCYHSQFVKGRSSEPPTFLERMENEAAYWGQLIGARWGEPYASREPVGLKAFSQLI